MHANGQEGGGRDRRSHLLAVALPRPDPEDGPSANADQERFASHGNQLEAWPGQPASSIPAFDQLGGLKVMETIVGGRRQFHVFAAPNDPSAGLQAVNLFNFVQ
jgi:hypothetical protein